MENIRGARHSAIIRKALCQLLGIETVPNNTVFGAELYPHKIHTEVLTLSTSECDCIWR